LQLSKTSINYVEFGRGSILIPISTGTSTITIV
jgi:hypothetical protein